jgi:hypothetical protein
LGPARFQAVKAATALETGRSMGYAFRKPLHRLLRISRVTDDWPSILARTGLEKTYEQFPDDVREALASALGLVERMNAEPTYADEPAHVFQAGRALDNKALEGKQ